LRTRRRGSTWRRFAAVVELRQCASRTLSLRVNVRSLCLCGGCGSCRCTLACPALLGCGVPRRPCRYPGGDGHPGASGEPARGWNGNVPPMPPPAQKRCANPMRALCVLLWLCLPDGESLPYLPCVSHKRPQGLPDPQELGKVWVRRLCCWVQERGGHALGES
jgi:hypothetical protein